MDTARDRSPGRGLAWWMRVVGAFYVVLGVQNLPALVRRRLPRQYPGFDAAPDSVAALALADTWFLFGIEIGVVGLFLVWAARDPLRHRVLVWLVLTLELLRGVAHDLHVVARGYAVEGFYIGFAILHLVIIASGLWLLRRATKGTEEAARRSAG